MDDAMQGIDVQLDVVDDIEVAGRKGGREGGREGGG